MAAKKDQYEKGDRLQWNWGSGTGTGKVEEVFTKSITRKIKGTEVTREATKDEPAYLLKQKDGDEVLKSHSEVKHA